MKLTNIADEVRAFNDRHPYPPPVTDLDDDRRRRQDQNRRRADYHLYWPDRSYRDNLNILVAGCGTAQAARYALRQPESSVIGIDVSATSIEHTETLKRQYDLTNLEIQQLPIERAHELEQRFDKVICTGVLHHLPVGAAGVLINQNHTYTDLILPIDAEERRLFDSIDGQQTIGEILDNIPVRGGGERVGNFFKKLWWYDQVVFDTSRQRGKSDDGTI